MDNDEVVRRTSEADVKLVAFLYCDNGGIIRGKTTHVSSLERRIESGIGLTVAMQAMNDMDMLQPVDGMGATGEVRIVPDLDTFSLTPYATKRAYMIADLVKLDRQPWEACTRNFLKHMLKKAEDQGIRVMAAFEPEWSLAIKEGDSYVPYDQSLCFSTLGMTTTLDVIDEIVTALEDQGIEVELYHPELGQGQQEISIRFADGLRAADNQVIYRDTVRSVAWKHGIYASFAPKPFPNQAGNGCHIHFSAWDTAGERNMFYDAGDSYSLSETAYSFMAGVLNHLPGLMAMTAPSVNSYRRLVPSSWSSAYVCYGQDNREAAIRVPSRFWGNEMASTNLELKVSDSSCNPYIALGGLIAAGLNGIENGLAPIEGQRVEVDPGTLSPEERESRGIHRLPANLGEAAHALSQDTVLTDALGPMLADSYLSVRRSEWELFSNNDEAFELKHHFYKY